MFQMLVYLFQTCRDAVNQVLSFQNKREQDCRYRQALQYVLHFIKVM